MQVIATNVRLAEVQDDSAALSTTTVCDTEKLALMVPSKKQ
jgi:hypothetical protein